MEEQLKRTELGSNCCGAPINDPGGTGEGTCTECHEHCGEIYEQEVDLAVLDFANTDLFITRLEYNSDEHETIEEFIEDFLMFKYGSTADLQYMYSEHKPIRIYDEVERVEKDK